MQDYEEREGVVQALDAEGLDLEIDHKNKRIKINGDWFDIGWAPFPKNKNYNFGTANKSSQELFMESSLFFTEVLYHGTRGIGKTEALIASYVQFVDMGYGRSWRGVIFRKTYKALTDLIRKSKERIPRIFPDAKFLASKADLKWEFAGGETLSFDVLKDGKEGMEKYEEYHGQEIAFMGFDEITRLKDLNVYHKLKSCLRVTKRNGKTPPMMIRATTNPDGPGKNAVKKYFIDGADKNGVTKEFLNIRGRKYTKERLHIKGSYLENEHLPEDYEVTLAQSCEGDPARFAAWLEGDWEAVTGGMFGDNWEPEVHKIQPFLIPRNWEVNRAMDWGTSSPFAVGWWCKTDGSGIEIKRGNKTEYFAPPAGSLIMIHELYGCLPNKPEKGINITPAQLAERVLVQDGILRQAGILSSNHQIKVGPADSNMFSDRKMAGVPSEASVMKDNGVEMKRAIKGASSRVRGANLLNQRLFHTKEQNMSNPHIYIFSTCKYWIQNVPILDRSHKNQEDVEEGGADHDYDMTRYRLMEEEFKTTTTNSMR